LQDRKLVAGYVRLSRDDDSRNYVSIENQKLIIGNYAESHGMKIDRWYEDDGYSGYKFDRPAFTRLIDDMEHGVETVIAKDLSRIGRHNARVLILLDEFKEHGKRLIIIDDNYDTLKTDEDDIIGIKTWVNEKYVKDTSKKIRSVFRTRQKEGTLIIGVPFGYQKRNADIEIVSPEAEYIRMIFDLYLSGLGFRKIAEALTEKKIPTPSMMMMNRYLSEGKTYKRKIAGEWTDGMVAAVLKNDFYIGNLRLHKRGRNQINGKDNRIPKENQLLFANHHPPIIKKEIFDQVQKIFKERAAEEYRGKYNDTNIYAGRIFCKDCGGRMTPITRSQNKKNKYYICSTYNNKGKRYCSHSHLIREKSLTEDIYFYISLCRAALGDAIDSFEIEEADDRREDLKVNREKLIKNITSYQTQLEILLKQEMKEIELNPENAEVMKTSFENVKKSLISEIREIQRKMSLLEEKEGAVFHKQQGMETARHMIDDLIEKRRLTKEDICLFIKRIEIDKDGIPDIELNYKLNGIMT
jgi:DNA invertase Pin-like site-specific DNA recombinase